MRCAPAFALSLPLFGAGFATAATLLTPPAGSVRFGTHVHALPNGNFVIADPQWSQNAQNAGAVYVYSAAGVQLSRITGSSAEDRVGSGGIRVLASGNFVVLSPEWNGPDGANDAGAVTFGRALDGFGAAPAVSAANSLVGTQAGDSVGSHGVILLRNGHYVVLSAFWNGPGAPEAGAVTWADGLTGIAGPIGTHNSLLGTTANDQVGGGAVQLVNGNYVIASPDWDAATAVDAGAVTWCPGQSPCIGPVGPGNSLVGASTSDRVGSQLPRPLANGHYAVAIPAWDAVGTPDVGAVLWGDGAATTAGEVTAAIARVGSTAGDMIGSGGLRALANGDFVGLSPLWDNGTIVDAGAATRFDGTGATDGEISTADSLFGSHLDDRVGSGGATALANGNYVVLSPLWDEPQDGGGVLPDRGAATWVDGSAAATGGAVSTATSRIGMRAGDLAGASALALSQGNVVLLTPGYDAAGVPDVGAATWCDGTIPCVGNLGTGALTGSAAQDRVGSAGIALEDGGYLILSPQWDGAGTDLGAVTKLEGSSVTAMTVSETNSLVGAFAGDAVGLRVLALGNGEFAVVSPLADIGGPDRGALTRLSTNSPPIGPITAQNSAHGYRSGDFSNLGVSPPHEDGAVILTLPGLKSVFSSNDGAVRLLLPTDALGGPLDLQAAVLGQAPGEGSTLRSAYSALSQTLVIGAPAENRVYLVGPLVFRDGFE